MQPSATEPPGWIGYYYDGRSAERQRVYVLLEAGGIRIARPDGSNVRWPFHAIRPARQVNETDHVQLETRTGLPQALIVQDPGFLPALRSAAPTLAASPAPERPARSWRFWLASPPPSPLSGCWRTSGFCRQSPAPRLGWSLNPGRTSSAKRS